MNVQEIAEKLLEEIHTDVEQHQTSKLKLEGAMYGVRMLFQRINDEEKKENEQHNQPGGEEKTEE